MYMLPKSHISTFKQDMQTHYLSAVKPPVSATQPDRIETAPMIVSHAATSLMLHGLKQNLY